MKIVCSDKHKMHDPGYLLDGWDQIPVFEVPDRIDFITKNLSSKTFEHLTAKPINERTINAIKNIHSEKYFGFISSIYQKWTDAGMSEKGVIPYVFPRKTFNRSESGLINEIGRYAFDTCSPIVEGTFEAALNSVEIALTGADLIMSAEKTVYSLCRPPGHHSGRDYYGGFCYFNNIAIAAKYFIGSEKFQKVAILDIDYHHGNGTQDIFYSDPTVLFVSIHVDPAHDYPYYWGYSDENGESAGTGYNFNYPLPPGSGESEYLATLEKALKNIISFAPEILLISLGADIVKSDPLGSFLLDESSFSKAGAMIAGLEYPILIVQEGGYDISRIGNCVSNFLKSFI